MSKVISLYPTKITQPNANDRNPINKWSFQEVRRGGKTYSYGSANPTDPRYFHTWTNTSNLLSGGKTQCGRPSTYHCSHKTYYSIKGYRNTCPIAGCNGTYNAPATLQLHFSKEALESKGMTENSKIEQIKIVFQHACTGVDVGTGKETTVWGPNFDGYKTYPNLEALKVFFTNANKVRTGEVQNTQGDSFNYGNPPLSKTFSTVTAIFNFKNAHATLSDIGLLSSGAFNIVYGRNLSTNPGNIYLKNAIIKIKFSEPKLFIESETSGEVIYTSSNQTCQTKLNHIITAGYKNDEKILSNKAAPKVITSNNIAVHTPKGVTYTAYDHEETHRISYMIKDESNQTGKKQIEYKIKGTNKSVTIPYIAKKYNPSLIKVPKTVLYDLNETEALDTLIVKNGCLFKLEIYLDSINNRIMNINEFTSDGSTNWVTKDKIKEFGKKISKQKCGKHTLYFRRNNESNKDVTSISYTVTPRTYRFQFTCEEVGYTEDTQTFEFDKNTEVGKQIINIKRVDNHQPATSPKFLIVENTLDEELNTNMNQSRIEEISINESVNIDVSTKNIGQFFISIQEYNQQCDTQEDTRDIIINQNHIQHHDIVYVRGEDSTSFDYKYIAVWEGDEVRCPIDVTDVNIITQNNDIHVCTKGLYQAGLSQTGIAQIVVHNQSQYKKDLQNIDLEINVLDYKFEVTTEDFFEHVSGMLSNLYNNFEIYNPYILDNVSLKHLTPDDDTTEEENVYLHINELPYNEKITINIPFQSNISKTINMQFLLFGEVLPLYQKDNCQIPLSNNYITLATADSIMTQLTIDGVTNMHYPNIWYDLNTGDKEEESSCPNECFNTKKTQNEPWYNPEDTTINGGITYTIQNVESATSINNAQIIISNDKEVIPFGWVYEDNYCFLDDKSNDQYCQNCPDNQNCPVRWIYEDQESFDNPIINGLITLITHFPAYDETIVKQRTDKNGETTFLIEIPYDLDSTYTISQLINENIIALKFDGNSQTQACRMGNVNIAVDNKLSPSHMDYVDSFRKYYPGQVIELHIKLTRSTTQPINDIILDIKRLESNATKQLTVFYKICNLENNQGIFHTTLKTNSINMIPNETTQTLYCGINTDIKVYTNIKKKTVEKDTLNTIYLSVLNKKRDNHNIICDIKLGQVNSDTDTNTDIDTKKKQNIYTLTDIDIDTGTYVYDTDNNKITWFIGSMKAKALTQATIIIKGEEIGPSNIQITTTDFLKDLDCDEQELDGQKVIDIMGHYLCSDCSKQN